jgi:protein-L-isoaspartate(D-aspartate) O-methyltransferase
MYGTGSAVRRPEEALMAPSAADRANQDLVDRLIAQGALWSPPLIAAFRATPRHRFLDRVFQYQRKQDRWREVATRDPGAEELRLLYSDRALITRLGRARPPAPISSSSQPSLMAQMLEDLRPEAGQRVLEVGAGTGYNAALLAHRVGPGLVTSLDVDRAVLAEAEEHLRAFPERRLEVRHADGRLGLPEAAPYARIMVTAATPDLEPAWLEQLAPGGVLLAPLVLAPGLAYVVRGTAVGGMFHGRLTRAAYFMPLRAEGEEGPREEEPAGGGPLQAVRAPWAEWFDRRRPRLGWVGFIQALAFYAYLRGLDVAYRASDPPPAFRVADPGGAACVLGVHTWQVSGAAGRDLGWRLWRGFLDAGGPWPTEFQLHARPAGGLRAARPESYLHQGPRCQHLWQLMEPRERPAGV